MVQEKPKKELHYFTENAQRQMDLLCRRYDDPAFFQAAVSLIREVQRTGGRIHVSGIGKMHHAAGYCASLLSSLGEPAYFLDGTEATHGSSGQVAPGDLVICLSYYGDVQELNRAITTLKANGARILSLTGFAGSWIAGQSDVHLNVFIEEEGDALNKPPRMSMLSTLFCFQCLSLCLQSQRGLDMETYLRWHPAGIIGEGGFPAERKEE